MVFYDRNKKNGEKNKFFAHDSVGLAIEVKRAIKRAVVGDKDG